MITYRSEIWEAFLKFIDVFRAFELFKTYEEGRYKKRLDDIYEKIIHKGYIRQTDIGLVTDTIKFAYEKNITEMGEFIQILDLSEKYGMEYFSTAEGEEIFKKAEKEYHELKAREETLKKIEDAKVLLEKREEEHKEWLAKQEETKLKMDEARKELKKQERELKKINIEDEVNLQEQKVAKKKITKNKEKLKKITLEDKKTQEEKELINV